LNWIGLLIPGLLRMSRAGALVACIAFVLGGWQPARAADTSLLFVGEDLSVLTIASRRAESPERAPAVAQVITGEQLEKYGVRTLGEALSMLPGFHIAAREWGSQPYLRGVGDSILFLYDSVPLTSDSTKSIHPLDEDLSLASVERIEVIRGPGSVLWGPDAFAGIVNIVPKRGRDVEGIELNARGGSPSKKGSVTANLGHNAGLWEGFASLSATSLEPSPESLGQGHLDRAQYVEAVFNVSWQDWLRLSGRWSDADRPYAITDQSGQFPFEARKKAPFRFLRLEGSRDFERASLRLNAFHSELKRQEEIAGLELKEEGRVYYGEFLYDRELFSNQGLLTLGSSYRYDKNKTAQFLSFPLLNWVMVDPDMKHVLPKSDEFDTRLFSVFGQYKHHWNHIDGWVGLRHDNHNQYDRTLSYNMGLGWAPNPAWNIKLIYGTAYRTPYDQQLVAKESLDAEEVQSLSAEFSWRPRAGLEFKAVPFWNQIRRHIQEDPIGGLSQPGQEHVTGVEVSVNWQPTSRLTLWANGTFLSHSGDKESYRYLQYRWGFPNKPLEPVTGTFETPFDTGPKNFANAGFSWKPLDNLDISCRLTYIDSQDFAHDDVEGFPEIRVVQGSTSATWLVDATATLHDVFCEGLDIQLAAKNLFDRAYEVPGTYSLIENAPFGAYLGLTWHY
jgi:outer membrane receptor protein involved in Fe transport